MGIFSKNIGVASEPASADISPVARALQQQNIDTAKGYATAVSMIGGTIWETYKAKEQNALEGKLKNEINTFQSELDAVKSGDTANKAILETEVSRAQNARKDYFNAAILAGTEQMTAAERAVKVSNKPENSILESYRATQQKLMAARDSMPQRHDEMMIRSEKILKQYIAQMPGLANNFRQIAEEVTGKRGLDLYSVNRLYEDVNFIEKQTAQRAKDQAAMAAKMQEAYVNDRKRGNISETQALAEYSSFDPQSRLELANISAAKATAKADAEAALALGGQGIQNFVTHTIAKFDTSILEQQAAVLAQLQNLGITKAQLRTNTVPEALRNKPEYIAIMEKAGTGILNILDVEYQSAKADIQKQLTSNVIDSGMARTAQADLDKWYNDKNKFYTENKTSPLLAFASDSDPVKLMQQRLTLVNTYSQTLQLPPEIIAELLSSDPKTAGATAIRYPKAKQQLDYLNSLTSAALRNVSNEEWMGLLKQVDEFKATGVSAVPTDNKQASAALININQEIDNVNKKLLKNEPVGFEDLRKIVSSGMASPANAETFFAKMDKNFDIALSKLPEPEKKELIKLIEGTTRNYLYGFNQYGDIAKTASNTFKDKFFNMAYSAKGLVEDPQLVFTDNSGLSALKVSVYAPMKAGLSEADKNRYTIAKTDVANARPTSINNRLEHVDTILKLQAKATGLPIADLRKSFMETFNKEGLPSSTYVAPLTDALNEQGTLMKGLNEQATKIVTQIESIAKPNSAPEAPDAAEAAVADEKFAGQSGFIRDDAAMEERRKTIVVEQDKVAGEEKVFSNPIPKNNKDIGYGLRDDKTFKGKGWFGPIPINEGKYEVTEYSIDKEIDGKTYLMPTIVPTLTIPELKEVLSVASNLGVGKISAKTEAKIIDHAMKRIKEGKSPFAEPGEEVKLSAEAMKEVEKFNVKQNKTKKQEAKNKQSAQGNNSSSSNGNTILQGLTK
jgi:hypothetical protein